MAKKYNNELNDLSDIIPIADTRSNDEKIGNIKSKKRTKPQVSITIGDTPNWALSDRTTLTAAEKENITHVKRIMGEQALTNLMKIYEGIEMLEADGQYAKALDKRIWLHEQVAGRAVAAKENNSGMQMPKIRVDFSGGGDDEETVIEGIVDEG